ncbi:TDP-N-acetylfucosamine:lipid II N-acetylfucosaminyltransferase [Raoultella ornithinolytica]
MRKLKILHLCTDEKFIDRAINLFETAYPEQNLLCVYNKGRDIVHIKRKVDFIIKRKESFLGIDPSKTGGVDIVIIHSLAKYWFRTIEKLDNTIPVVWLGWGYDYYDLMGGEDKWLLRDTLSLNIKITKNRNIKQRIKDAILYPNFRRVKVIERINYFSPVIPGEYKLIKDSRNWKKFPVQVDWNYGAAEKDLACYIASIDDISLVGKNVLIGNSATNTNNHIEIFNVLKHIDLLEGKFIIPLNYGNVIYGRIIKNIAINLLGENADVISDFMPLEKYMSKISSCGFVVMNHVRQQGVGNIISMIYIGAKVFLREENPTFIFLRDSGVKIYSVQDLERDPLNSFSPLSQVDVISNRSIIDKIWSNSALLGKTRKLISTLTKGEGGIEY